MNPLREFLANAEATKFLRPGYYAFTTCVGLVAVAFGIYAWYVGFGMVADFAGIPLDQPANSSDGAGWMIAWLVLGIPLVFYMAMVLVAGLAAIAMFLLGHMSKHDAIYYALLSRYPSAWFKEAV